MTPTLATAAPRSWLVAPGRRLELHQPCFMGILNVTPDSFSDGGRYLEPALALEHGRRLVEEGAAIIDVGGESTRPGAARVDAQEQIRRTIPVIRMLRAATGADISIDTTRAEVAEAALDAGATIINDVSAGTEDQNLFALAARRGCGLIIMHRLRPSDQDSYSDRYRTPPVYGDVTQAVIDFLALRADAATAAGVERASIVVDPGLGFGKTVEQNYQLIRETGRLLALGFPVLGAASRKSFLGAACGGCPPEERLPASLAASLAQWAAGVRIFRVHDVAAQRQALAAAAAVAGNLPPA